MKTSQDIISKIKTYVGFAFKAGKCVLGVDNIVKLNRPVLILYSNEISNNSKSKLGDFAIKHNQVSVELEDFTFVAPREGVKALAIKDKNLAIAITKQLNI